MQTLCRKSPRIPHAFRGGTAKVILGLACVLLLAFISQHAFAQVGAVTYNNGIFAMDYATDWQVLEGNPTTFQLPGQQVQVTVTIDDSPKATTLQDYTNYETSYLTSSLGASVGPPMQGTLAGFPAVILGYSDEGALSSGIEDAIEMAAFDNSGTLYKVVYSASPELFDTYFPVAKIMMLSFSLAGSNTANNTPPPEIPAPSHNPPPSNNGCPTPGPGGCGGAFNLRGGQFGPIGNPLLPGGGR